ncbi:ferritin-like domain-containing protein [Thermococcus sp.]
MYVDDVLEKLAKLSPKEILGYAIASEEDAKRFYEGLASKSGQLLGEFFTTLAKAEEGHKKILLRLHETLFGDASYTVPEGIPFAETPADVKTVANLMDAMRVALINEKTAERIYSHLGKLLPEHKGIFGFLAAQERAHYASIKSHVEYLEDVTQGRPEYAGSPVHTIQNQFELYLGPRARP